jgi:hypothetical protein
LIVDEDRSLLGRNIEEEDEIKQAKSKNEIRPNDNKK